MKFIISILFMIPCLCMGVLKEDLWSTNDVALVSDVANATNGLVSTNRTISINGEVKNFSEDLIFSVSGGGGTNNQDQVDANTYTGGLHEVEIENLDTRVSENTILIGSNTVSIFDLEVALTNLNINATLISNKTYSITITY